jgi:NifU-like protein involved in Fe-S cluster formation
MSIWDLTDEDRRSMQAAGYSKKALDLFNNPRYLGEIEEPSVCHTGGSELGERLRFCLRIEEGKIVEASYTYRGCPALSASAAATIEASLGKTTQEVESLILLDVWKILGRLPAGHEDHVELSLRTMKDTLNILCSQKRLTPKEHALYKHLCGLTGEELDTLTIVPCSSCEFVQNCENNHTLI